MKKRNKKGGEGRVHLLMKKRKKAAHNYETARKNCSPAAMGGKKKLKGPS